MSDICEHLETEADEMAWAFVADYLPLAETEKQRAILRKYQIDYRAQYLTYRQRWCAARDSSVGPMIAGRSGYTTSQARQHGRAIDRQHRLFYGWEETRRILRGDVLTALRRAQTPEQRTIATSRKLIAEADDVLEVVAQIDRGQMPGCNRASFVTSLQHRINRAALRGELEAARICLRHIEQAQAGMTKPMFTKRNRIWAYLGGEQ